MFFPINLCIVSMTLSYHKAVFKSDHVVLQSSGQLASVYQDLYLHLVCIPQSYNYCELLSMNSRKLKKTGHIQFTRDRLLRINFLYFYV